MYHTTKSKVTWGNMFIILYEIIGSESNSMLHCCVASETLTSYSGICQLLWTMRLYHPSKDKGSYWPLSLHTDHCARGMRISLYFIVIVLRDYSTQVRFSGEYLNVAFMFYRVQNFNFPRWFVWVQTHVAPKKKILCQHWSCSILRSDKVSMLTYT